MKWTVRKATIADIDRLALVGGATFLDTFAGILDGSAIVAHCKREHNSQSYQQYLEAGSSAWLAECNPGGGPVGFALLGDTDLPSSKQDGTDVELKRIYVLSRLHGLGIGAGLMHLAVDHAKRAGAHRLLLGVYAHNARAIGFYGKSGFTKIADRRFRVGDNEYDDVVLAKSLT